MSCEFLRFRERGYDLLKGVGIEIGSFEHPAVVPYASNIIKCDRINIKDAKRLFPEVNCEKLEEPDLIFDLDTDGLNQFVSSSLEFVIMNHVIEHLVNPISAIEEIARSLKPEGYFVVSAPDKEFTFDKNRPLSKTDEIINIFLQKEQFAPIEKYLPVIKHVRTDLINAPADVILRSLENFRDRREHLHVWHSVSFKKFLMDSFTLLKTNFKCRYEIMSDKNNFEYFGVWQKC